MLCHHGRELSSLPAAVFVKGHSPQAQGPLQNVRNTAFAHSIALSEAKVAAVAESRTRSLTVIDNGVGRRSRPRNYDELEARTLNEKTSTMP
jgi:hypothetical protein